jgi:Domain of unkown function (DUF1775)
MFRFGAAAVVQFPTGLTNAGPRAFVVGSGRRLSLWRYLRRVRFRRLARFRTLVRESVTRSAEVLPEFGHVGSWASSTRRITASGRLSGAGPTSAHAVNTVRWMAGSHAYMGKGNLCKWCCRAPSSRPMSRTSPALRAGTDHSCGRLHRGGGPALPPGREVTYRVKIAQLPVEATRLAFKTLQTYCDGRIERKIEIPTPGKFEPPNPAPILTVAAAATPTASAAAPRWAPVRPISACRWGSADRKMRRGPTTLDHVLISSGSARPGGLPPV